MSTEHPIYTAGQEYVRAEEHDRLREAARAAPRTAQDAFVDLEHMNAVCRCLRHMAGEEA